MTKATCSARRPPLRVGVGFLNGQSTYVQPARPARLFAEAARQVRCAEALGFDSVWVNEHHFAYDGHCPSPIPVLAHAAASSERIAVGAGVMVLTLRTAAEVAHQCAAMRDAAPGRLRLAVGIGYANIEFLAHHVHRRRRGRIIEERLDTLIGEFSGLFADTELWMGGTVPAAVRRAARYGASLYLMPTLSADAVRELRDIWESELRPRPGQQPRVAINGQVWVDDDRKRAAAFRVAAREAKTTYDIYFDERTPSAAFDGLGREARLDAIAAMVTAGPAGQIVDHFAPLIDAGVDDVIFTVQQGGASHEEVLLNMERIATDVVGQLPTTR